MENRSTITTDEWFPVVNEMLKAGKEFRIAPKGYSMYPFIASLRDEFVLQLPKRQLKKGDICLYRRDNGQYVIHRIFRYDSRGIYMLGDSQINIEGPLRTDQMLALAIGFYRKGKYISCSNKKYRMLAWIWLKIRRLRPFIISSFNTTRRLLRKQKKSES